MPNLAFLNEIVFRKNDDPAYPPIMAVRAEQEGYEWAPVGYGKTQQEAMTDLMEAELDNA